MNPPTFFTLEEAAQILRVHKRTMHHLIARAKLRKGPLGRWRLTADQIMKLGAAR